MNLESKYKTVFESHQTKVEPKVWEQIESRLDEKQTSRHWWWVAAAVIVIGLILGEVNTKQTSPREVALQVQLNKIESPYLSTTNSTMQIVKHKRVVTEIKEMESPIQLSSVTLQKIGNPKMNLDILGTPITQVQVKIRNQELIVKNKADNPIEGLIELASDLIRKKKKQINLPIIEIDYNSLLTLK